MIAHHAIQDMLRKENALINFAIHQDKSLKSAYQRNYQAVQAVLARFYVPTIGLALKMDSNRSILTIGIKVFKVFNIGYVFLYYSDT